MIKEILRVSSSSMPGCAGFCAMIQETKETTASDFVLSPVHGSLLLWFSTQYKT